MNCISKRQGYLRNQKNVLGHSGIYAKTLGTFMHCILMMMRQSMRDSLSEGIKV